MSVSRQANNIDGIWNYDSKEVCTKKYEYNDDSMELQVSIEIKRISWQSIIKAQFNKEYERRK